MLTVVHARRQHGSVWRTDRVLCVASYHSPSLGMFCKRDVSILALIIPVLKFMSFVPDANLFEYLVPQVLLQTLAPAKLKSVYCIFLPFCQKRL